MVAKRKIIAESQVNLSGERIIPAVEGGKKAEVSIWQSILQKSIRRGLVEKAMYAALKLLNLSWWQCWRRLEIISVEDCCVPSTIVAVDVLFKEFMAFRGRKTTCELDWEMKRCAVAAAKIMAESQKDRTADEFLEIVDELEKGNFAELKAELESIPDFAVDMHTIQGRSLGRGYRHWLKVGSQSVNRTSGYEERRKRFELLMKKSVMLKKEKNCKAEEKENCVEARCQEGM